MRISVRTSPTAVPAVEPLEGRRLMSVTVRGIAFVDLDGDGVRGKHEPRLPNAQIYLDVNNDAVLDDGDIAGLTSKKGAFAFGKLKRDVYHLREVEPAGYTAIDPGGQAYYIDLRFKGSAAKRDFGYWPLSQGTPPNRSDPPIADPDPPIPLLMYNTGATEPNNADGTNSGPLLDAAGPADPYYVVQAYNPAGGPQAFTTTYPAYNPDRDNSDLNANSTGVDSFFLAPVRNGTDAEAAGTYLYATAFDLTGFEPSRAIVTGTAVADDRLLDVRLNGVSLGVSGPAGTSVPFAALRGFVAGVNTLEFLVANDTLSPSGLRVDSLRGTSHRIAPGAITLFNTGTAVANSYDGSNASALTTGTADGHWQISTPGIGYNFYADDTIHHYLYNNALTSGRFGTPFAAADNPDWENADLDDASPGVDSTFLNASGHATDRLLGGTYIYRTTFDLSGLDSITAQLDGTLYADGPVDVYLNGNLVTHVDPGPKRDQGKAFTVQTAFVGGVNVLDFVVTSGPGNSQVGLRVDRLRGTCFGTSVQPKGGIPLRLPLPTFPPVQPPVGQIPTATGT